MLIDRLDSTPLRGVLVLCLSTWGGVLGCAPGIDDYDVVPAPPPVEDPCDKCSAGEACLAGTCETVVALAAGAQHTCLRTESKGIYCWGKNDLGQLCRSTDGQRELRPGRADFNESESVIAGFSRTCAVDAAGQYQCCGGNLWGELGLGVKDDLAHPEPELLGFAEPHATATLGGVHTCVRKLDGALECVGLHDAGQLGAGPGVIGASLLPVEVALAEKTRLLTLGESHGCAVAETELWCWGRNSSGQIGDGSLQDAFEPVQIETGLLVPVEAIVAGWGHTCGAAGGRLSCWGENAFGELGKDPALKKGLPSPSLVEDIDGVVDVVAGEHHTCARTQNRSLWCWGSNASGQAAAGGRESLYRPELVMEGVVQVVAGSAHTCALTEFGVVSCWGANSEGQLGTGDLNERRYPTKIVGYQ